MDAVFLKGASSVQEVIDEMADPPSYSAVRATIGILVDKGHLVRKKAGNRFIYAAAQSASRVRSSLLKHVVKTFFKGSAEEAMAAILDSNAGDLDDDQLRRLSRLIDKARKEGR